MPLPNIFKRSVSDTLIARINQLQPISLAYWGKMTVAQMLAHCCVSYEMFFEPEKHKAPGAFARFLLKNFVKPKVVGEKSYPRNNPTAPAFIIADERDFEVEKMRLIQYINRTQALGREAFEGKVSLSFGKLTASEWNNLFYKHLDHHLKQFGV